MLITILSDYSDAIFGIVGTIIGVILGALINQFSRSGKLKIYPKPLSIIISKQDGYGSLIQQESVDSSTKSVIIRYAIDFYNRSADQKIGRNISLVIMKDKKELKVEVKDTSTKTFTTGTSHSDQLNILNFPPKTVTSLILESYPGKENFDWINGSSYAIEYYNEKNKNERINIPLEDA